MPSLAMPAPADLENHTTVSLEMQDRIIKCARYIIVHVLFTENTMISSKDHCRALISDVIINVTSEPIIAGTVHPFITKVYCKKVSEAFSLACNKLIFIAYYIVITGYDFFPPNELVTSNVYCVHIVNKLIDDPL